MEWQHTWKDKPKSQGQIAELETERKKKDAGEFFKICLSVIIYFVIFTIVFIILFSIFVLFAVCCLA